MSSRVTLNRTAIMALAVIIITAIAGIIVLSFWGLTLRYGVFGAGTPDGNTVADEALSILGNVASAAVGGLVGWLTRDYIEANRMEPVEAVLDEREMEPEPVEDDPAAIAPGDNEDDEG